MGTSRSKFTARYAPRLRDVWWCTTILRENGLINFVPEHVFVNQDLYIFSLLSPASSLCHPDLIYLTQNPITVFSLYGNCCSFPESIKYINDLYRMSMCCLCVCVCVFVTQTKEEMVGTVEAVQALQVQSGHLQKSKEGYHGKCLELDRLRKEGAPQKELEKVSHCFLCFQDCFEGSTEQKLNRWDAKHNLVVGLGKEHMFYVLLCLAMQISFCFELYDFCLWDFFFHISTLNISRIETVVLTVRKHFKRFSSTISFQ